MKYLKEILAVFGLILFLIIFVRLVFWLLRCNISRNNKQKNGKIKRKKLNTKSKSSNEDQYSSQIKAIDQDDNKDENIDNRCINEQPVEMLEVEQSNTKPKFIIISEEQLPNSAAEVPDSESFLEEHKAIVIKMVPNAYINIGIIKYNFFLFRIMKLKNRNKKKMKIRMPK